jgi:hypothetical protein
MFQSVVPGPSTAFARDGTVDPGRAEGPYFRDWGRRSGASGWSDGDPWIVNYVGTP